METAKTPPTKPKCTTWVLPPPPPHTQYQFDEILIFLDPKKEPFRHGWEQDPRHYAGAASVARLLLQWLPPHQALRAVIISVFCKRMPTGWVFGSGFRV